MAASAPRRSLGGGVRIACVASVLVTLTGSQRRPKLHDAAGVDCQQNECRVTTCLPGHFVVAGQVRNDPLYNGW